MVEARYDPAFAAELAADKITVNTICPGRIATGRLATVFGQEAEELARQVPIGRIGEPEEIASVALFLASSEASYITGQTIYPDGGRLSLNYTVAVKDEALG